MFGLKFPCINKTIQGPLKKYSKVKDFFTHSVFQDTFLRETEKKRATIIVLASECILLSDRLLILIAGIQSPLICLSLPLGRVLLPLSILSLGRACCLHGTLLHPVYIKNRRRSEALPPHLSPCGDNKTLGSHIPCNQHEVILQASMKEPFVQCLLCDTHLLMV